MRVLTEGSYCERHYRKRDTPGRTTRAQSRFREAVLANAGHRCQWVDEAAGAPRPRACPRTTCSACATC